MKIRFAQLFLFLLLVTPQSCLAALLASSTFSWVDSVSGGAVEIAVDVFDNFAGDFSKYEWQYSVDNLSYDPVPGTTNGFSGLVLLFPTAIPEVADQFAPSASWLTNCCGFAPPGALSWDMPNSAGPGILVGSTGSFGFSTAPRHIDDVSGIAPFITSFAYTYDSLDDPVNLFKGGLLLPGVLIPHPPSLALLLICCTALFIRHVRRYYER